MVRYQVPERALAIGQTMPPLPAGQAGGVESLTDGLLKFFNLRSSDDDGFNVDEALRDYDELDGREDTNNGTSTRFYRHVHWSRYTAVIFGGLFAVMLLVVAVVRWGRRDDTRGRTGRGRRGKDHLSDSDAEDLEEGRANRIRQWHAQVAASGLYHSDPPF